MINENGEIYIGEFKDNKKHGKGINYTNDGIVEYRSY